MSSFIIYHFTRNYFYLSYYIQTKESLTNIFCEYYFLVEKEYFKIFNNFRLKYSEYTYCDYSYINML